MQTCWQTAAGEETLHSGSAAAVVISAVTNLRRHSYQVAPQGRRLNPRPLPRPIAIGPGSHGGAGSPCTASGVLSAAREPKGRLRERSQARAQLLGVRRSSRLTHKLGRIEVMRCRLVRGLGGLDPLVRLLDGVLVCSAAVCGGADMCGARFAARVAYAFGRTPWIDLGSPRGQRRAAACCVPVCRSWSHRRRLRRPPGRHQSRGHGAATTCRPCRPAPGIRHRASPRVVGQAWAYAW